VDGRNVEETMKLSKKTKTVLGDGCVKRLQEFSDMKENWAGFGELPLNSKCISDLDKFVSENFNRFDDPCVFMGPDGCIELMLTTKWGSELEITFNVDDVYTVCYSEPSIDGKSLYEMIEFSNLSKMAEFVKELIDE
jgi:hypothetical protein